MTLEAFLTSLRAAAPPSGLDPALTAVWLGLNDRWAEAHGLVQDLDAAPAALVHAWLHRIEGDDWNAGYWYRRAGAPAATGDTQAEGRAIAARLLARA